MQRRLGGLVPGAMTEVSPDTLFQQLLEHDDVVQRLAARLTRDEAEAADVAQQTWLVALRRPPGHAVNLRGWLARIVQKHRAGRAAPGTEAAGSRGVLAGARSGRGHRPPRRPPASRPGAGPGHRRACPNRSVAWSCLHYYRGWSRCAPSLERLSLREGTVASRLSRAHDRLRKNLHATLRTRRHWMAALGVGPIRSPYVRRRSVAVTTAATVTESGRCARECDVDQGEA